LIKIHELTLGQLKYTLKGHSDWVWGLDEVAGEALVSVSNDCTMKFWTPKDQVCYKTVMSPQNKSIRCLKVLSETRLAFASERIWIYNTLRDDIERHFVGHVDYVRALVHDKKRNYLLSGGEDQTIRFWNWDSGDNFKSIACGSAVLCLDVWENEYVVCGVSGCSIMFWD
jgi:WD40 repeat protein